LLCLVAIMDRASRAVLTWHLYHAALEEVLRSGTPQTLMSRWFRLQCRGRARRVGRQASL
jgi:hypothetical protein